MTEARCEIKRLYRGILEVKPPYTRGYVNVEWRHVAHISSTQLFEFETEDGRRLFGSMRAAETARAVDVDADIGSVALTHDEIVRMVPIESKFWDRSRGSIDVGLTGRRANSQVDLNVGGKFSYRTRKYSIDGTLNSLVSRRDDVTADNRPPSLSQRFDWSFVSSLGYKW